jgi:hypothetical protein
MKIGTRQKALRIMLGALVDSELSPLDLKEIASELEFGDLTGQLARTLDQVAGALEYGSGTTSRKLDIADLYRLAQQSRLPKTRILNAISQIGGPRLAESIGSRATLRDILERFASQATTKEIQQLRLLFERPAGSDAYLAGILNRHD